MATVTKTKAHTHKTKKPTGLAISRNGDKVTFSWKIGDTSYSNQTFKTRINNAGSTAIGLAGSTTSKTVTVNLSTLEEIGFELLALRAPWQTQKGKTLHVYSTTQSDIVSKTQAISAPAAPVVSCVAQGSENLNEATFSWTAVDSSDNWALNFGCTWESILIQNCSIANGASIPASYWKSGTLGWQTGTSGPAGGSVSISEGAYLASGSYTRWFRVRANGGAAGNSGWTYSKHVYAAPYAPSITSYKFAPNSSGGGALTVYWSMPSDNAHPVDSVAVRWKIATAARYGGVPSDGNWTEDKPLVPTASGGTTIDIGSVPQTDQGLFIEVVSKHDNRVTESIPYRAWAGYLATPDNFSIDPDFNTNRVSFHAENKSTVPDTFLVVKMFTKTYTVGWNLAIIPAGETEVADVQVPAGYLTSDTTFGVMAVAGRYEQITALGVPMYRLSVVMKSVTQMTGGTVPVAPASVTAVPASIQGTIRVTWAWSWSEATFAELSWADHEDAWESTDEPETYNVNKKHSPAFNISGLATGITWYVRIRFGQTTSAGTNYGCYSDIVEVPLATAPAIPVLEVSPPLITAKGSIEASWGYVTSDGTGQGNAVVAEVKTVGGQTVYTPLAETTSQQSATISAQAAGWDTGETHYLVVRVASTSGKNCDDWSAPVPVTIAEPMTAEITADSLQSRTVTVDGEDRTFTALTEMPLTLTVEGAGIGNTTMIIIERSEEYFLDRPDESVMNGYKGEAIAVYSQIGEAPITITNEDLIGALDDGAKYRIIATTKDEFGQSATVTKDFEVLWDEQALIPEATVEIDNEEFAALITLVAPQGAPETARCDIYRLSVDKPVLVYKNAEFGETYVDPFPTIGEYGGHRIVYKTENGDSITAEDTHAWLDLIDIDGDELDVEYNLIDWGSGRVKLEYNIDLSHSWSKDFTETKYLGGAVQGDWNPAVTRSGSIGTVAISTEDQVLIQSLRRLAVYPGICHVRTKDGSSYSANIDVSESYAQNTAHKVIDFDLKVTRIDEQAPDGMTLEAWRALHPIEG